MKKIKNKVIKVWVGINTYLFTSFIAFAQSVPQVSKSTADPDENNYLMVFVGYVLDLIMVLAALACVVGFLKVAATGWEKYQEWSDGRITIAAFGTHLGIGVSLLMGCIFLANIVMTGSGEWLGLN